MKVLNVLSLLICGFSVGWVAHSFYRSEGAVRGPAAVYSSPSSQSISQSSSRPNETTPNNRRVSKSQQELSLVQAAESPKHAKSPSLIELLNAGQYLDAIDLFQTAQSDNAKVAVELRRELLAYMTALMAADNGEEFTALVDAYLSYIFDDVDVLLLLAEFNKKADYYSEAISVYQLAKEYAYRLDAKKKVKAAFSLFLGDVDQVLAAQQDWYGLAQVYGQAELVGLLASRQQLRFAEVYISGDEHYLGRQVITQLIDQGKLVSEAKSLLAQLNTDDQNALTQDSASQYETAVALEKYGNQYLVNLVLDDQTSVRLLMDTGASVTTLSTSAFERISAEVDTVDVATRMFNTANGLAKGRIVRVDSVSLGEFSLQDTNIAILDFEMSGGIDGLLGMNVLGAFKFQIEPTGPKLLLTPR